MNKEYVPGYAENRRLILQNKLLDSFDYNVYEDTMNSIIAPLRILDVGCNCGGMFVPKLEKFCVESYTGIDINEELINKARQKYAGPGFHFRCMNIEADNFTSELDKLMHEHNIASFNLINISMVLLHLKDPLKLLSVLRNYLDEDGSIIIRDIDDGLNMAYPDENGWFRRIYQIAEADELTGNRSTGRKIFHYLSKAGYSSIMLRRVGLSTAALEHSEKPEFYEMTYKTILDRTVVMYQKYPDDPEYIENRQWAMEHEAEIQKLFMQDDFISIMGFMTYTARH